MQNDVVLEFLFAECDPMLTAQGWVEAAIDNSEFPFNCRNNLILYARDLYCTFYVTPHDNSKVAMEGKIFLDSKYSKAFLLNSQKTRAKLDEFYKKTLTLQYENLPNPKLLELFNEYIEIFTQVLHLFWASQYEPLEIPTKRLKSAILLEYPKKELDSIFSTLVTNPEFDLIKREELEFTKLANSKKVTREQLQEHALKNAWLFWGAYDEKTVLQFLQNRLTSFKSESYNEKLKKAHKQSEKLKKRQAKLFEKFKNDKEVEKLAILLQQMSSDRLELKAQWTGEYRFLHLFSEIARRLEVSITDLMATYQSNEIQTALTSNLKLTNQEIQNRKKHFIFIVNNRTVTFYSGENARIKADSLLPKISTNNNEIKGITASPGIAMGVIRRIEVKGLDQLIQDLTEFKEGEILVTSMTQPTMVTMAKKAAAIITDEGGLTSHAAVIAREFKIPCIVGCKNAMKQLKTGDLVTVDTNKATVTKIRS